MSLGWGKISVEDWKKVKAGPGQDRVPPGDYEVELEAHRHMPEKDDKLGVHIVQCRTTEVNAEEWQGKQLDIRMSYTDKDNPSKGHQEMNRISYENCKAIIKHAAVEDQYDTEGNVDISKTLDVAVGAKPRIVVTVSHRDQYQDVGNIRATV